MLATNHNGRSVMPNGLLAAALLAGLACAQPAPEPITWEPDRRVAGAVSPGATMVLLEGGVPAMQDAWTPVRWPDDIRACKETFVAARALGDTVYAAWRTGFDSLTAAIRVARSRNAGIAWDDAVSVGRDEPAPAGCGSPAPGIAVDNITGAVHVVFHGGSATERGVRFATATGKEPTFAAPVMVAAGVRPVSASVAAAGDTIAIAFESPTVPPGVVRLAIFLGGGHIPAIRSVLSDSGVRAFAPAVSVSRGRVGAAWNEVRRGTQGTAAVARVGKWTR